MQVIFQTEFHPAQSVAEELEFISNRLRGNEGLIQFAQHLLSGTRTHLDHIDAAIAELAKNWRVDRMSATDRSILRLAAYEIVYGDTPGPVVINEAIELAKRFGSEESGKFVNGILDRLNKQQNGTAQEPLKQENPSK